MNRNVLVGGRGGRTTSRRLKIYKYIFLKLCFGVTLGLIPPFLYSLLEQQEPTASPEDWVDWFLHRMQQEPWALGGFVVLALFALGTLALAFFALLYGCCCGPRRRRRQEDSVI